MHLYCKYRDRPSLPTYKHKHRTAEGAKFAAKMEATQGHTQSHFSTVHALFIRNGIIIHYSPWQGGLESYVWVNPTSQAHCPAGMHVIPQS